MVTAEQAKKGYTAHDRAVPCLFILDDFNEAFDVRYFCGQMCRLRHKLVLKHTTKEHNKFGTSVDWIEGTVCDQCGEPV
jgi:hypothetical protein